MTRLAVFAAAALTTLGLLAAGAAIRGVRLLPAITTRRRRMSGRRLARALAAAAVVAMVTRWPVATVTAGVVGWWWDQIWGTRRHARRTVERTDALASWLESLRDALLAGASLEDAIRAGAPAAPPPIRDEVLLLAARLEIHDPATALTGFADDVDHPVADLAASALTLSRDGVADMAGLFGDLAVSARDEAHMHRRVDAERRRALTIERSILATVVGFAVLLAVTNRSYLAPYGTPAGQLVLAGCVLLIAVGMAWLRQLSRYQVPRRWLVAHTEVDKFGHDWRGDAR